MEVLEQVRYLQLCPRLATLTLEGNLVYLRPGPSPSNEVRLVGARGSTCTGWGDALGPPTAPGASPPTRTLVMSRQGGGIVLRRVPQAQSTCTL